METELVLFNLVASVPLVPSRSDIFRASQAEYNYLINSLPKDPFYINMEAIVLVLILLHCHGGLSWGPPDLLKQIAWVEVVTDYLSTVWCRGELDLCVQGGSFENAKKQQQQLLMEGWFIFPVELILSRWRTDMAKKSASPGPLSPIYTNVLLESIYSTYI